MTRYGCYISALCMALHKLRGHPADPRDAVRYWDFDERGMLLSSTRFKGMKIAGKKAYYSESEASEYANSPNKVCILVLGHGSHYVYIDKISKEHGVGYIDSLDGQYHQTKYGATHLGGRRITGMRLYEATVVPTPEWMEAFIVAAKAKGLNVDDPLQKLDIEKLEEVLYDLGYIKEKQGEISLGRLLVIIEKIKEM